MHEVNKASRSSSSWGYRVGCSSAMIIAVAMGAWLWGAIKDAREAARSAQCRGNLAQLHFALHSYHEMYGCFPPAYIADSDGKPMHSWRVLILPFIDQAATYKK